MKFSEIASRLTGVSCPVFGISWNPPEAEIATARRAIAFLEDRRVLYNPTAMETPSHCVQSVIEIRRFLTDELGKLDPHDDLAQNLLAMRAACRKFMDQMQSLEHRGRFLAGVIPDMGNYSAWVFCSALGELRGVVGLHVALIAVRNGLDVEHNLASILPGEPADDHDFTPHDLDPGQNW